MNTNNIKYLALLSGAAMAISLAGCGGSNTDSSTATQKLLATASAGGAWVNTSIATQTGVFTVSYDASVTSSPSDAEVGLSSGAQTAFTGFPVMVRFNTLGKIDARNAGAYAATTSVPFSANVVYHFRLVVDASNHKYSVYVTAPGGSEQTVASNYGFRTEVATVSSINNWAAYMNASSGSETVNNFTIGTTTTTTTTATTTTTTASGGWIADSSNIPVQDVAGCGYAATPSTSTSASFDFGLTCSTLSGHSSYQRGEWKYERRSGWHRMNASFNISTSYQSFDKISIAQTHDDSTGSDGVFSIYQIRQSSSSSTGWEFGVQGDTFSYTKIANISLGTTYNLDIATNSSGSATETAILSNSSGTVIASKSISGGGSSLQYKKIGTYGLTDGHGPVKVTWSNLKFYTK